MSPPLTPGPSNSVTVFQCVGHPPSRPYVRTQGWSSTTGPSSRLSRTVCGTECRVLVPGSVHWKDPQTGVGPGTESLPPPPYGGLGRGVWDREGHEGKGPHSSTDRSKVKPPSFPSCLLLKRNLRIKNFWYLLVLRETLVPLTKLFSTPSLPRLPSLSM